MLRIVAPHQRNPKIKKSQFRQPLAQPANEGYPQARLTDMCILFPPRVGDAGFRLDTFIALNKYLRGSVNAGAFSDPREMVFTLIP